MKSFKKILRLLGLVLLIVLASFGVCIGGGAPIQRPNKKEDTIEIKIEIVKSDNDEMKMTQFNTKR